MIKLKKFLKYLGSNLSWIVLLIQLGKIILAEKIKLYYLFLSRTLIILFILILSLCFMYKLKLQPDAYFNSVSFPILFFGYLIFGLQLISFCIMNAQLFDKNVRAIGCTFLVYLASLIIFSNSIAWPVSIQYILIFFSPYIAGHSIFQVRFF